MKPKSLSQCYKLREKLLKELEALEVRIDEMEYERDKANAR
jgi:hypothetical protein